MEFDLIENSLHSLYEALNYYHEGDTDKNVDKYKFSILLAGHCAELMLKEILRRNHPSLVFENIDKVKNITVDDDEQTVGYKLAIQRVKSLCQVDLGRYENYLLELGRIRNRIQHYKCSIEGAFCKTLMSQAFSAIEFLFLDILRLNFVDYEDILSQEDIAFLHEDATAYQIRKMDIHNEFKTGKAIKYEMDYDDNRTMVIPCPSCGFNGLSQESKIRCKMCGNEYNNQIDLHENDDMNIISNYVSRELGKRKRVLKFSLYECPKCDYNTVVYVPQNDNWVCLNCGAVYDGMSYCEECGDPMPNDAGITYLAMSDYNTEDFKYLCPTCAKDMRDSEKYIGYEITRN